MEQRSIDLNCDMGEGLDEIDNDMIPLISSANIACGGHAGNEKSIECVINLCKRDLVAVGAHPSYPDRDFFGRKSLNISIEELQQSLKEQIDLCKDICKAQEYPLHHIKLHGALYNDVASDKTLSESMAIFFKDNYPGITIYGLSGSLFNNILSELNIPVAAEVFADRGYCDDGSLIPRNITGSLIVEEKEIIQQSLLFVLQHKVKTQSGLLKNIKADTICLHSDTPGAIIHAASIHKAFKENTISIRAFSKQLSK